MGANPGGGNRGTCFPPPHFFEGGGHNQMSPPPPPLFLGWMIINWNEDPFYMFSDVMNLFFFACQKGLWCRMGTPILCLDNWAKNVESKKKKCWILPPPHAHQLFWELCDSWGWREDRGKNNSVSPPRSASDLRYWAAHVHKHNIHVLMTWWVIRNKLYLAVVSLKCHLISVSTKETPTNTQKQRNTPTEFMGKFNLMENKQTNTQTKT